MQLFGHRGAAGEAPENTIAGIRHAIARGVRRVEIDLRLSADKKIVIVHDSNAKRTTGVNQAIARLTASELSRLDARQFGTPWPRKTACGIPTLQRYLNSTPEIQCYQLEVKLDKSSEHALMIEKLGTLFPTKSSTKKIVVTSFDYLFLSKLRRQFPHIPIGVISYKTNALSIARDLDCQYFCINTKIAKPRFIEKVRKTDMHLSVWTVNNPEQIKTLYQLGVDSIISDYPSMALPLINSLSRKK